MKKITLNSGIKFPIIGLGTFKIRGADIGVALDAALAAGYRAIDTAAVYRNESDIGACLKELLPKYALQRGDVAITSKLGPKDHGLAPCRAACLRSMEALGMEYLDLFLIHWPACQGRPLDDPQHRRLRAESWRAMEALHKEGKLRAIGVSNYTATHLEQLLAECEIKPAVLQVEHHPHLVQGELLKLCLQHGIHYQAYSSLGTSAQDNQLMNDPVVQEIAEKNQKTAAQILLRWAVQQDIGVIPKSTNPVHIKNNIDIFDFVLSPEDMDRISGLHKSHHYCWNPHTVT